MIPDEPVKLYFANSNTRLHFICQNIREACFWSVDHQHVFEKRFNVVSFEFTGLSRLAQASSVAVCCLSAGV